MIYGAPDLKLVGYTDPNFELDRDDDKNVSRLVFTLNEKVICWKGSRQITVVDSICEAEYLAVSDATIRVVTKVPCRARGGTSPRCLLSSVL